MFGGLSLKAPSASSVTTNAPPAPAPAPEAKEESKSGDGGLLNAMGTGSVGSAFSFMQPTSDASGIPSPDRQGGHDVGSESENTNSLSMGMGSGFSFLSAPVGGDQNGGGEGAKEQEVDVGVQNAGIQNIPTAPATDDPSDGTVGGSALSGFSFLTSGPVAASPANNAAPAPEIEDQPQQPSSGFGFLNGGIPTPASANNSADLIGDISATAQEVNKEETTAAGVAGDSSSIDGSAVSSGFSFLTNSTGAATEDAPVTNIESDAIPSTSMPGDLVTNLSATPKAPASSGWAAPSTTSIPIMDTSTTGLSMGNGTSASSIDQPPASDLLAMSKPAAAMGTGLAFDGAAAAKKAPIKKKRRGKKIGVGASTSANISPTDASTSHIPEPPVPPPTSAPTPVPAPPSSPYVPSKQPEQSSTRSSTIDDAEEAARKAEQFMNKKKAQQDSSPFQEINREEKPMDATVEAAEKAAEAAKSLQRERSGGGRGIMSGLFNRNRSKPNIPFFNNSTHGSRNSNSSKDGGRSSPQTSSSSLPRTIDVREDISISPPSIPSHPKDEVTNSSYSSSPIVVPTYGPTTTATDNAKRQAEEDLRAEKAALEARIAEEKRKSWLLQEEERRIAALEQARVAEKERVAEEERLARIAAEEAIKRMTPSQKLDKLLADFSESAKCFSGGVAQLRAQRSTLSEERTHIEKQLLFTKQQISLAETQQTAAAEEEDYELADRLACVIEKHTEENQAHEKILHDIEGAFSELDAKREGVVKGVTDCFKDVKEQLVSFQKEQETRGKEESSVALDKFEATSKRISTESERLAADLKPLERDEEQVAEERFELETSIQEQTVDEEEVLLDACTDLERVTHEMEVLRKQLAEKEKEAAKLNATIDTQNANIDKVREKFSRQLNRLSKKENTTMESRSEWKADSDALASMKECHEKEVEEHSEILLQNDDLMKRIESEVSIAVQLDKIISEEINTKSESNVLKRGSSNLVELVECQAAVDEADQEVIAAEAALKSLETEIKEIDERLPLLNDRKRAAASGRDFKTAGIMNKEIKGATARKERCEEELALSATERVSSARENLEKNVAELEAKKLIVHEKEKEQARESMVHLAKQIKKLKEKKEEFCEVNDSCHGVAVVGASVLDEEINALTKDGEALGAKFEGWEDIMALNDTPAENGDGNEEDVDSNVDNSETDKEHIGSASNNSDADMADNGEEAKPESGEKVSLESQSEEEGVSSTEVPTAEAVAKWKELTKRVEEYDAQVEEAVASDDYEKAEELDNLIEGLNKEIKELGLSDETLEAELAVEDEETNGES